MSKPALGSSLGKNCKAMVVARKPYTAKSNHSTKLPMAAAPMTFLNVAGSTRSLSVDAMLMSPCA
ncbi:hypothetical protein D3C86_2032480 [compost metagenome]